MFERYTETARRVIFFARYEASECGSPYIEAEHLLLGWLRGARGGLTKRFNLSAETIRSKVAAQAIKREKIATTVDLPLSNPGKRILAYAAEEAERLQDRHIGAEHLFLGILREKSSLAAELLTEAGVELDSARRMIHAIPVEGSGEAGVGLGKQQAPLIEFIENGQPLSITTFLLAVPRAGEEIVLMIDGEQKTYQVTNVRFSLVADPAVGSPNGQRLEKIQVLVEEKK